MLNKPGPRTLFRPALPNRCCLSRGNVDRGKGGWIEPWLARTNAAQDRHLRLDLVRNLAASSRVQVDRIILQDSDGQAAHRAEDAVELPATQQFLADPAHRPSVWPLPNGLSITQYV